MTVSTLATDTTSSTTSSTTVVTDDGGITVHVAGDVTTCTVAGSIDLSNADVFREALGRARTGDVVLDLTGVEFFGTAALTVVAALDAACAERGSVLTVRIGDAVARVMVAARWQPAARVVDVRG